MEPLLAAVHAHRPHDVYVHVQAHTLSPESKPGSPSGDSKPKLRIVERGSQACNECRRHKVRLGSSLSVNKLDRATPQTNNNRDSPQRSLTTDNGSQIRCHPAPDDPEHIRPCARCVRMMLECVFKKHNRGRKRKNPLVSKLVPLSLDLHTPGSSAA
jgi:hypothetical protein